MVFSTNQNRQLYVGSMLESAPVEGTTKSGIYVHDYQDEYFAFEYVSADGSVGRSDLIRKNTVEYLKVTPSTKLQRKLNTCKVKFAEDAEIVVGEQYIVRVNFSQYNGMSDYDTYTKVAEYVAKKDDKSKLLAGLAVSLANNLSADADCKVQVYVGDTLVKKGTDVESLSDVEEITLVEIPQDYVVGVKAQAEVLFDVTGNVINDAEWIDTKAAKMSQHATKYIPSGYKMAELEYFCMGERGDQYRQIGWPYNLNIKYLVDPSKEYDVVDIHYSFSDSGVSVQKSEKEITLVVPAGTGNKMLAEIKKHCKLLLI